MSKYQLIAFVSPRTAEKIEAKPDYAGPGTKALCVQFLDMVAVLSEPVRVGFLASARTRLTAELGHFQKSLEVLMTMGPVVPAAYGTKFASITEALVFTSGNITSLREAMINYGHLQQYQINIQWEEKAALKHFRQDPRIAPAISKGGADMGREIQKAMEKIRVELAAKANMMIIGASMECIEMPVADTSFVTSMVALVAAEDEPALMQAVEAVDALVPDLFKIQYKGPLPACSFASVAVQVVEAKEIEKAAALLDVPLDASHADITDAFRAFIMQNHPDHGGQAETVTKAKAARDLLIKVNELRRANLTSAHKMDEKSLLLTMRRDGDARKAA